VTGVQTCALPICLDIVDVGPALLSMHSPFEISHKADIHASVAAFRAFYQAGPR
jgi:aspartyl aminopeptidase